MKIAFFADSYRPQINGMVTSIDAFRQQLSRKGHDVHVFAPEGPGYKDKERNIHRLASFEFAPYKEYRIAIPFVSAAGGYDIVHVHSPFSLGIAGIAYARRNGLPVVGTFHTLFPEYGHYLVSPKLLKLRSVGKLFRKISWSYLSWFYNRCDRIVAPSVHVKKLMRRNGITKPIAVIPTGIKLGSHEAKRNKKTLRKRYGFGDGKIILHVGRVTKEKNIDFVIASLKKTLEGKDARLVIASDGPYRNELERRVKKAGLKGRIIFTGYVSKETLLDYYSLSDALVIASKTETQGIVLIEAAASGLPVIALKTPVASEFIEQTRCGLVSGKNSFHSNVKKILEGKIDIGKPDLRSYDIKKCTDDLISLYKSALKK
ncbi:MAG: glycosyltransferase [Candidatus Aenigmarchaeota archaeon]|nr:glycosyltransferase [Candidatus Aenigmarchaeota archaeon]